MREIRNVSLIAAVFGVVISGSASLSSAQTTQPVVKDDAVFALSNTNAFRSVKHVKADFGVKNSGTVTGTSWGQSFIQSVEFDNLNGFRHNSQGNLLGLDFGTAAAGGRLVTLQTSGLVAGQATPGVSTELLKFNGIAGGTELGRVGGLSVSPTNTRLALSTNEAGPAADKRGKLIVLDYTAGPGTGVGASVSNYRSIEIEGLRVGTASRTSSTMWLDSNNVLVVGNSPTLSSTGNLYKVTVAGDGSLSSTKLLDNLFEGFNLTFTAITYEPTISPYVFVSGSGFSGGTINKLIALDPANSFAAVTSLLDFSPSSVAGTPDGEINTSREMAFDSKGNLVMGAFIGSTALSDEYGIKSLVNGKDVATLSNNISRLVGILRKDQTSDATTTTTGTPPVVINGTSSSFNGIDVAMTNVDYANADVQVTIGNSADLTQQYFGAAPTVRLRDKMLAGKIATGGALAVGYAIVPGAGEGTFRLVATLKGDTDLSKVVDFDDLLTLAQSYGMTADATWAMGDSTYDGMVDFDDLLALAQTYGLSAMVDGTTLASMGYGDFAADWALALQTVPEPTTLAALGFAGMTVVRRRR